MNNNSEFETYLYLSENKISICVIRLNDQKRLHEKEILIEENLNQLDFDKLQKFLDDNIIKIEKILNDFIKNIFVILKTNEFFPIQISIKSDNNGNIITPASLSYSLNEAKDLCKKSIGPKKIIHMFIENYLLDDKNYSSLPKNLKCNNYSLDIKFICLSINLIEKLENSLERYQISINRILSLNYIESVFNDDQDLFQNSKLIIDGYNENEIRINSKVKQKPGFFEKFFNIFN
jgi:hypothetical protein